MGRKSIKITGALVKMGRRRRQGLGIIIATTDKPPNGMTSREREQHSHKPIAMDFQASRSKELCALVHWFERPSEWENTQTWSSRTWVPLSWLRVVKKEESDNNMLEKIK